MSFWGISFTLKSPCLGFQKHLKYCTFYCIYNSCLWSISNFQVLANGLVVRALDYQSRGFRFKTIVWPHLFLSLSLFEGQLNEDQVFTVNLWLKVSSPLIVSLQSWGSWTVSRKSSQRVLICLKVFYNHLL